MSERENTTLVMGLYDAYRRGDIATIMQSLDPDVVFEAEGPAVLPYSGIHHGLEGAAKYFGGIRDSMDEVVLDIRPFAAEGDNVAMSGRYRARVISTGQHIDVPIVHLFTIRKGKVVRYQNLSDTGAVVAAFTAGAARA